MPSDLTLNAMTAFHRTGLPRTVILTSPARVGEALVVVASRGGDDRHPAWFLNLQTDPEVRVALRGGPAQPMRARTATSQERDDLWPRIVADHPNYADDRSRTSREIPLVLLEAVGPAGH